MLINIRYTLCLLISDISYDFLFGTRDIGYKITLKNSSGNLFRLHSPFRNWISVLFHLLRLFRNGLQLSTGFCYSRYDESLFFLDYDQPLFFFYRGEKQKETEKIHRPEFFFNCFYTHTHTNNYNNNNNNNNNNNKLTGSPRHKMWFSVRPCINLT